MTHDVMLENGEKLSEELVNLPEERFKPVIRKGRIHDVDFKDKSISYMKDVVQRFVKMPTALISFIVIVIIVFMAIFGPYMSGNPYLEQNNFRLNLPPRIPGLENLGICDGTATKTIQATNLQNYIDKNAYIETLEETEHIVRGNSVPMLTIKYDAYAYNGVPDDYYWFGTDNVGRDLFSRIWMGTRVSLILAFAVALINLTVGLIVGSIAGYYGGWVDFFLQRIMEILNNIPQLPLAILLIMLFGAGLKSLMLCFVLTGWVRMAYSVRIQFYRYKGLEYVLASRTMGAKDFRIMFKYILPNAIGTLITVCALTVPNVIFQEAGLSYLGLGVQAPEASIGTLLADGQKTLLEYPYMIVFPGVVIVVMMLSFNKLGDGLRDAFNPTLRQ